MSAAVALRLGTLGEEVEAIRRKLLQHQVYGQLRTVNDVRVLMQHHVWAVWDFMSLLKSIQAEVAPVTVPWRPPRDAESARLINEIVVAEESDDAPGGGYGSHFGLYLEAMRRAGADRGPIDAFLARLDAGESWQSALAATAPPAAQRFVETTLSLAAGSLASRVASLTVGREEIIPDMFREVVGRLAGSRMRGQQFDLEPLRHYLQRHIEVDGDRHGPMSTRLFERVCLADERARTDARHACVRVLAARIALWDAIGASIVGSAPLAFAQAERATTD